jgi:hypothetical protein
MRFSLLAARVALTTWALAFSGVGGWALSRHLPALPLPDSGSPALTATVAGLVPPGPDAAAVHVIYGECPCSRRVLDAVLARGELAGVDEAVVLVGADPAAEARVRARGWPVRVVAPERLVADIGVEAAPLLIVADAAREVLTVSGYTASKQSQVRDAEIIREALAGHAAPLPLFGCAVSGRLRQYTDGPLAWMNRLLNPSPKA